MIDIHCHIIPEIDDGSETETTTIEMLKIAEADGITKMIATPHYCSDLYDNFCESVIVGVEKVNEIARVNNINIEILPGQEIYLDNYTIQNYKNGLIDGLNNTKYMLVETQMDICPEPIMDILYELTLLDVIPILAHPERYEYVINNIDKINDFIDLGCLFQMDAKSLVGEFGKSVKKTAIRLVKYGVIDFVGSDAHGCRSRTPEIKRTLEVIESMDKQLADKILVNPEKIINNDSIEKHSDRIKFNKSIFSFINSNSLMGRRD